MSDGSRATSGATDLTKSTQVSSVFSLFARHVNQGQLKYVRAGHLDVLETERSGVGFTDPITGRRMFDCFTSAGCFNVGRHNPTVMQALEEAIDENGEALDMGSYCLLSRPKLDLARKLASMAPGDLDAVLFASGGGEAVDCALKLARGATGRKQVISTVKAYHGHTGFALSANGKQHYRHYCEPLMPGFSFVPFNDLDAVQKQASEETAAIIIEPVQGEAGIFPASREYLHGLRALCDELGIVLIFDEIQTGFGRTGKLFACEHSGVIPDIMTVAKSLAGGLYPNAAMLYRTTPALKDFIAQHPSFHVTYSGGSDIACRVSLRVLEYVEETRLWENAARVGERLKSALLELQQENPTVIKDVRGVGLMVGMEYCHEFMGPMMSDALAKHGVFAAYSGNAPQVMRFMPPITVNDEEIETIIQAIRAAVADMRKVLPFALLAAKVPGALRLLNSEHFQTSLFSLARRLERKPSESRDVSQDPSAPHEKHGAKSGESLGGRATPTPDGGVSSPPIGPIRPIGPMSFDLLEAKREGTRLYDDQDARYVDCVSGAGAFNLGRRPPELVEELKRAMRETDQGNFPMISEEKARLAEALAEFVPGALECAVFSVTRGEAMDAACKVARGATGRPELVTVDGGWYGQTGFAMTLSERDDKELFGPLIPDVRVMPFGNLDAASDVVSDRTAAVILEPLQMENHCREASEAYLQGLSSLCRTKGALLVLDETQTNFGRTGAKFACESSGVVPDILVLGEALGGGMFPIAATMLTQRVNRFLNRHPLIHLSTFGGSDVGCRVALKALELYERTKPWENAARVGANLLRDIEVMATHADSPVRGVTGSGLALSLDLGSPERAADFCAHAAKHGLLVVPGEVAKHTVVLRPCLTIDEDEAAVILRALIHAARATVSDAASEPAS